jgi:predicted double-glycine peptidase
MHRNSPRGVTHGGLADLPSEGSAFPKRQLCGVDAGSIPARGANLLLKFLLGMMPRRVAARFSHAQVQVPAPIIQQSGEFSCGSAALLSAIHYWLGEDLGPILHEADLWESLEMNIASGAEPERIAAVARKFGLQAHYFLNMKVPDLHRFLARKIPVILCIQAWPEPGETISYETDLDHGHYVEAVGFDAERTTFMDPSLHTGYGYITNAMLPIRWHDADPKGARQNGLGIAIWGNEPPRGIFPAVPMPIQ